MTDRHWLTTSSRLFALKYGANSRRLSSNDVFLQKWHDRAIIEGQRSCIWVDPAVGRERHFANCSHEDSAKFLRDFRAGRGLPEEVCDDRQVGSRYRVHRDG